MKTNTYSNHDVHGSVIFPCRRLLLLCILSLFLSTPVVAQEHLFETVGAPEFSRLPDHVSQARQIRINRRALQGSSMIIDLFGEQFIAERDRVERQKAGQLVWVGHLRDNELDSVIITLQGNSVSGLIQRGDRLFRLGIGKDRGQRIFEIDVETLPPDDADALPDGGGDVSAGDETTGAIAGDSIVQDLLVVYNQGACDKVGGCPQLEADIVTAVADINTAYAASGITIYMNLVGTARTVYTPGTSLQTLYDLSGTTDGLMDEIHPLRNDLGADLVSFVYNGPGCGIGYLKAGATTAFSVVAVECLVGNRSMAHEIGHNQGAHHDRLTVGTTSTGDYNYGFRRCNDSSVDNLGSPFFRTILSYPCTDSPRVGRFSNPDIVYQTVPQGVDPRVDPSRGAWNSRVLNERAVTVAGFRSSVVQTIPAAPSTLKAAVGSYDTIGVTWADNSGNETAFILQSSPDNALWSTIATLPADTISFQHTGLLPESTHYYRVRADNSVGSSGYSNTAVDTTPASQPATPPNAPSNMTVTNVTSSEVSLQFADKSEDEYGFEILRSQANPSGDCNAGSVVASLGANTGTGTILYADKTVMPTTDYWYWAKAYNAAGDNGECSNMAQTGTLAKTAAILLTAKAYKVKGVVVVDLKWSGITTSQVDIVRDGSVKAKVANTGSYTDNTGKKGGGSITYKVCATGTVTCSPLVTVMF